MTAPTPPGWYPDRDPRQVRWFDGRQWTHHVQPAPPAQPQQPADDSHALELAVGGTGQDDVQRQVQKRAGVGGVVGGGGGTLFSEPVLVVNQKAKMWETANEYAVYDQHGRTLGSVTQVGQSGVQKAMRMLTKLDSLMEVKLEIRDVHGTPLLHLTRPATMWKSTVHVQRGDGSPVGSLRMENVWGKVRFAFEINGQRVGGLQAQNLRGWDISVLDDTDIEVGQISKTWQGLAKAAFTTADNYVLQIHRPLPDPLISLVVASALTVDTVLSQVQK